MILSKKLMATCALALLCTACATNDKDSGGQKGSKQGPPAAAFTACEAKSAGDSCSVTSQRGNVTGSCKVGPRGNSSKLACVPTGGKPSGGRR
ncbi:hypothetical protein [Leucothrix arctica]|uniref:DUF333 domain-containing protein n=1 Tax=Leucothrix arctica TaxID=1481894 RepID=A0A317CGS0_9GAMM|nr:hypothetical protein [Leucothrix arctica]PWQ97587.1 hypothetical protein DKT75_06620 [Leucothrix arctica]